MIKWTFVNNKDLTRKRRERNITSILDSVNPPGGEIFDPPGTYTYQTETNKLTHIEGTPSIDFGYDANANITAKNTWTYIYDLSNQLVRVLDNSNQVAEYTYNGAGQRIKKVTQTETRIFHYDLWGHLIAETNQAGQMLTEYIYLGDQLLAMIKPGEAVYYYHHDHLGTPQVLTDDTQTIVWKAVYTPFGNAVTSVQTVENPFRFPGQYYDQETGLHYNYFRYYNPQTGRYITPDPIGLEGGINLFAYVQNDPINWMDPIGDKPIRPPTGKELMGPGGVKSAPRPEVQLPRFVGYTYGDLMIYTENYRGLFGLLRLWQEVGDLSSKKAAFIPCEETVTGRLYFIIDDGVKPLYITTPEEQKFSAPKQSDLGFWRDLFTRIRGIFWNIKKEQSVTIIITGRMGCPPSPKVPF